MNIMQIIKQKKNVWFLMTMLVTSVILMPVFAIFISGLSADETEIWQHLQSYLLPDLVRNTFILLLGVLCVTMFLGVSLAWLTSMYDFYGRRVFERLLLMPLAIPAYVMAFVYTGLFDFSGPFRTFFRSYFPSLSPYIPEIRSAKGVILVMSFALFPYVFLMASSGFRSMGKTMVEASQALGAGKTKTLFKVTFPLARPWIFGGLLLVLMETLADFGAVSVFNYDTFTTAVYKAWYGFFSISAASQLASILVFIVIVILLVENSVKKKMKFFNRGGAQSFTRINLSGGHSIISFFYCLLIVSLAFTLPVIQLLFWAVNSFKSEINWNYVSLLANTTILALSGTFITMLAAVILVYSGRLINDRKTGFLTKLSLTGYALPGTVLAVGMVMVISFIDHAISNIAGLVGLNVTGISIQGSLFIVPVCYMTRFLTAGYNPVYGNMTRLTSSMDEAAQSFGISGINLLFRVHLPLLKRGLITGSLLVLVEIIKEMPVTLMTRPFGWDTLAVKIYELTSEGEWERAALPALTLIIVGMIPIFLLSYNKRS